MTSHRPLLRRSAAAAAALALTTGLAVAVAPGAGAAGGLTSFDDCAALGRWAREAITPQVTSWGYGGGGVPASGASGTVATQDSAASAGAVGAGDGGLNVQEAGVGEPATALAQDGRLVTTAGADLVVLDVTGRTPRRLGAVALPGAQDASGQQPQLLLAGDRAVVLTQRWPQTAVDASSVGSSVGASVVATVVDLSAPRSPRVVGHREYAGRYVDARLSGGVVRLVLGTDPVLPWVQDAPSEQAGLLANRAVLARALDTQFLPQVVERAADGSVAGLRPAVACSAVTHPDVQSGSGVVAVVSVAPADVTSDADVQTDAVGVTASTDVVYASTDRLYLATTAGGFGRPTLIDSTAPATPAAATTQVHGFAYDGPRTRHTASGEVAGRVLGRWAFSARDGFLRVATTTGPAWAADGGVPDSSSSVLVLGEDDGRLDVVGRVDGLGVGEQVRGVRYDGDRAYVVTFRQTDPLYVLDLADPASPRLSGELKVDGYSAYLHPVGDGRLLGVGQDADPTSGAVRGLQVSAVDVRDPARPQRTGNLVVPGSSSAVEWDARAFVFDPTAGVAVLPVDTPDGPSLRSVAVAGDGTVQALGEHLLARTSATSWGSVEQVVQIGGGRIAVLSTAQDWRTDQDLVSERRVQVLDARSLDGAAGLVLSRQG